MFKCTQCLVKIYVYGMYKPVPNIKYNDVDGLNAINLIQNEWFTKKLNCARMIHW